MTVNALPEIMAPSNCGSASLNASIGDRSGSVRNPLGVRSYDPFGIRSVRLGSVQGPLGIRSGSVRGQFGIRSGFVQDRFGEIGRSHNYRIANSITLRG